MNRKTFINSVETRQALQNAVEALEGPVGITEFMQLAETVVGSEGFRSNARSEITEYLRGLSLPYETQGRGGPNMQGQTEGYTPYGVAGAAAVGTEIYAVPVSEGVYDPNGEIEGFDGENLPEGTPTTKKALKEMHLDTIRVGGAGRWQISPSWLSSSQNFPTHGEVTGAEALVLEGLKSGGRPSGIRNIRLS